MNETLIFRILKAKYSCNMNHPQIKGTQSSFSIFLHKFLRNQQKQSTFSFFFPYNFIFQTLHQARINSVLCANSGYMSCVVMQS